MKKVLKYFTMLCLTVFVGIMFNSVDAKAARANGETSITVDEYSHYPTFSVHMDSDWSAYSNSDFVTVLNPTGTAGDAMIVLKIDSNTKNTSRSATVVVHDSYGAVSLGVYQTARYFDYYKVIESPFSPFNNSVSIGKDGGTYKFVFETDKDVTVTFDGQTPDKTRTKENWVVRNPFFTTVSKKSNGKGGYTYEYKIWIDNNNTYDEIEHKLEVKVNGSNINGGNHHVYTIKQSGLKKPTHHWWEDIFINFRITF